MNSDNSVDLIDELRAAKCQVAEAKPSPDLDAAFEERLMEGQYKTVEYNTAWQAALEHDEDDESAFRAGFDAAWNAAIKKAETR